MSTDIIHWHQVDDGKSEKTFQLSALRTYLAISLPFMLVTFSVWYGFHWYGARKEQCKARFAKDQSHTSLA